MEYSDIIIEGTPLDGEQHSPPVLPDEYRGEYLSCIPRVSLPNGRFVFYMRAERSVVQRIREDNRLVGKIVANSWSELFFGSYRYWDWVFDAEIRAATHQGIVHLRKKVAQVADEEIIGIYPPGVFAGDAVPDLPVSRFFVDRYTRLRDDVYLIKPVVTAISAELVRYLASNPAELHQLRPRQFEELICSILQQHGWDVELTPPSKDGGYDIVGFSGLAGGVRSHWIIECKKWAPDRKVGVEIVRGLVGVKEQIKAANAMIVTTSSFTRGAQELAHSRWDLDLRDYNAINAWLYSLS